MTDYSRETYQSTGIDRILEQVIRENFELPWKIEVLGQNFTDLVEDMPLKKDLTPQPGGWPTVAQTVPAAPKPSQSAPPSARRPPGAWPKGAEPKEEDRPSDEWPDIPKEMVRGEASVDLTQIQELWPKILEAVKDRRRLAWILLSNYAEIARSGGGGIRLVFMNDAARANYISAGANEVLEQVLRDNFKVSWTIDIAVEGEAV
jgi:DNA polymerase-3 subunit gamma/tau